MFHSLSWARSRIPSAVKSNLVNHNPFSASTRRLSSRVNPARPPTSPRSQPQTRSNRHNSTQTPSSKQLPKRPLSTSEKLKDLSRRYGWAAAGVYLGLSALDFPFCFLAVRMLGPERVGEAEHYVVDGFWKLLGSVVPSMKPEPRTIGDTVDGAVEKITGEKEKASIWTQLLIAYGVHKSLIFFRVPITAAITPNIVKYLRKKGWNVGKPKAT